METSSTHEISNRDWLAANAGIFDRLRGNLGQIEEQNAIQSELIDSGVVHHPELVAVVKDDLTTGQAESFTSIQAMQPELDDIHAELFRRWAAVDKRLADLAVTESLAAQSDDDLRRQERIIRERRPQLAAKIGEIITQLEQQGYAKLMEDIQAERAPLLEDDALFEQATAAWVIPQIINPADYEQRQPDDIEVIDTYPDEKRDPNITELADKLRGRFLDRRLVGASERLGEIFKLEPRTSFTREQVAGIMYANDSRTPEQRTVCVASLISAHELGKNSIIATVLSADGLVLQRGKRRIVDANGKVIVSRQPIFRAVPIEEATSSESITHKAADGSILTEGNWVDERARRAQKPDSTLKEVSPQNALETGIVNLLNITFREWAEGGELLDKGSFPLRDVLSVLGNEYPTLKSLRTSQAWKSGIAKDGSIDALSLQEVIYLSIYQGHTQYLRNPANVSRMKGFIDQAVTAWRAAAVEEAAEEAASEPVA